MEQNIQRLLIFAGLSIASIPKVETTLCNCGTTVIKEMKKKLKTSLALVWHKMGPEQPVKGKALQRRFKIQEYFIKVCRKYTYSLLHHTCITTRITPLSPGHEQWLPARGPLASIEEIFPKEGLPP